MKGRREEGQEQFFYSARGDQDGAGDAGGSGKGGGDRHKPPKEVSLTDPQATSVARPGLDPFLPMMQTTCSTTRPASSSMPWALGQTAPWRLPSRRPWWIVLNAASICGRSGLRATRSMAGQAAQMAGGSQHHTARTGVGQVGTY